MVLAITIASTAFSISDTFFTKISIDIKEDELLCGLYYLDYYANNYKLDNINNEQNEKAAITISEIMNFLDYDEIDKFLKKENNIDENENFIKKIESYTNDELSEFVERYINLVNLDYKTTKKSKDNKVKRESYDLPKNRTKINIWLASSIAIVGLISLFIILTLRIRSNTYVNNTFTIVAFFFVILNLLLREYYKANTLKIMKKKRNALINNLNSFIKEK
jgi:hypothetical protein